ncbi:16S rRNA (cytosine(1402)-N(4))-methyltransferase RsmH [Candidatus Uhrbacteria bacterium]|nr:16S rRNA (cytosine(1402)-N(4))-methyltransferase RsmH [Candidatus Uhrbacteria bacterium]
MEHIPVLAKEVLDGLALRPGMTVLDGTLGLGGHANLMLDATAPDGQLVGFDRDARNLARAQERLARFAGRTTLVNDSFGNAAQYDIPALDAALLDLGFSSLHVDDPARGFCQELTAEAVVNGWSRDDLAQLFRAYGEEPYASGIAKAITEARKKQRIATTGQLADLISSLAGRPAGRAGGGRRTHPATRVFQALRIAVNDELGELARGLTALTERLKPGGRLAVITFHSLEDRAVKRFMKETEGLATLTKKPVVPSRDEVVRNPRSRSAKLRIAIKQ